MDAALSAKRWLVSAGRQPGLPKIYLFPHGGGAAAEYVRWGRDLPGLEVHAVQLPGRGTRLREPAVTDMADLVAQLVAAIQFGGPGGRRPYTFFGHSLGALIAYEVARALHAAGAALPQRLILSGFRAPSQPREVVPVHHLADDDLIAEVDRRHGGFPPEVLADADLRALLAGYLRADYQVLETYTYRDSEPLPVPIYAFGGHDDAVSVQDLEAWGRHTTAPVPVRLFPGGHFYLRDQAAAVRRAVAGAVNDTERKAA
jgi:surfactin synthase thioesterase subunit